jgi:hypothetical protein
MRLLKEAHMRTAQPNFYTAPVYHDLPRQGSGSPPGRVFLVAVQGEQQPRMDASFDRVHVMVISPNEMADFSHPLSVLCALPEMSARSVTASPETSLVRFRPRAVRGEILRNHVGQFFERRGERLVALQNLVSSPSGDVVEFAPARAAYATSSADRSNEPIETPYEEASRQSIAEAAPLPSSRPHQEGFKKLFADPGQLRLVTLADFRSQLEPQLAKAERLRYSHRLPCYLQVFEILKPQHGTAFAAAIDKASAHQFRFVTPEVAHKLGLTELCRQRAKASRSGPQAPGYLLPGDLVCRLQIVRDPTVESTACETKVTPAPEETRDAHPVQPALKRAIPEHYSKPWEFRFTREEVMYEMSARVGMIRRFVTALQSWMKRQEVNRWRFLIAGKDPEDQLWAVRPPQAALAASCMREWATRTLALAGYEPQTMLAEWEIFWRRKGR